MNIWSSFFVAVGLSMDNLAVTVSTGCSCSKQRCAQAVFRVSVLFAVAHFMMFSLGFEGGVLVHAGRVLGGWIACAILVFIGGRMLKNAREEEKSPHSLLTSFKTQLALAVATSLDAFFVGAGVALVQGPFWQTQICLVSCVFVTSLCGFYVGHCLGQRMGPKMEIIGGSVLIVLGAKVLLEGFSIW